MWLHQHPVASFLALASLTALSDVVCIPCLLSTLCPICVRCVSVTSVRTFHQRHQHRKVIKGPATHEKILPSYHVNSNVVQVYFTSPRCTGCAWFARLTCLKKISRPIWQKSREFFAAAILPQWNKKQSNGPTIEFILAEMWLHFPFIVVNRAI